MSSISIGSIGVVGAGQMGGGIAQVAAQAGVTVLLADASHDLAQRGRDRIAAQLGKLVEKGKLDAAERDAIVGRITPVDGIAAFHELPFAVEAATENVELKKSIFTAMDYALPEGAILATNTSSISITMLAAATKRPSAVVGMHFMNPVPLMKLCEIIRGLQTSQLTYDATIDLAKRLGKTVVASKDAPGFIVNRLLIPFLNEACFALHEGLGSIEDIDAGIKLGLNHPMGPFALADLIGLDTCLSIAEVLHSQLGEDKYRPSPLLRQYVLAGWLGKKTGRGFYTY